MAYGLCERQGDAENPGLVDPLHGEFRQQIPFFKVELRGSA
jgi:hypothetical protein